MSRDGQRIPPSDGVPNATVTYERRPLADPGEDIYDQGLAFDLETLVDRRRMSQVMGYSALGAGILAWPAAGLRPIQPLPPEARRRERQVAAR